ncbi:glutaredoxin family protein [Aquabacterium sp.]|uniref:glutaredoxin family protein n=1 Tax=Aquabacterium sp. TaxID=1872578 RepID=UPI003782F3EE
MSTAAGPAAKPAAEVRRSVLVLIGLILLFCAGTQWWHWHNERQITRALAAAAKPGDIVMLCADSSEFCEMARSYLKTHGVSFSECSGERDADCAARYKALLATLQTPGMSMTPGMPVIVVRGQAQHGFMPAKVLERLNGA